MVALVLWYLRYAGLRVFTPEARLCATPPMHLVAGVQCVGPYKKSRKVMADKQAVMARYHLELPHFRLFLDDPATTPPEACRCIVGAVVEGNEEQRKFRARASNTRDLLESEVYGTELTGEQLQKIGAGPQQVNFRTVFVKSTTSKSFIVTNDLRQHIYVRLLVDQYPELA